MRQTSSTFEMPNGAPERLVGLFNRWQSVALDDQPTSFDLPFDDLVDEHPGLALIKSEAGLSDFRYVRVGPEHAERTGVELEGRLFSEVLYASAAMRAIAEYRLAIETGEPQYWEFVNSVFGSPPTEYSRLLLPLYNQAGQVDCLIGSWVWKDT